jgi:hypothetical protein
MAATTTPSTLSGRRVAALAACALALGAGTALLGPDDAGAATVSAQKEQRGGRYPVNFGGRADKGDPVPRGWVIVSRIVRMRPDERPTDVALTCPGRLGTRNFIPNEDAELQINVRDTSQYRRQTKRFVVQVRPAPKAFVKGDVASGTLYLACGRRTVR